MGELLRRNLNPAAVENYEEITGEIVAKILSDARRKKVTRSDWMQQTTKLMHEGTLRRGHLMALCGADTLRDVGFRAEELLSDSGGFELWELRRGGYKASEMKATKLRAPELRAGGYTAGEL